MTEMDGATAVAQTLVEYGVTAVFGVPGGHNLPLFGAIEKAGIPTIGARHEQGAGFMAEAYARVTGQPALVVTTAGPGVTNTLTPIAHAASDGACVCVLALDNYLPTLADSSGQFHGISDMRLAVEAFADFAGPATTPADAATLVAGALNPMTGRPARPAVVQLPSDVLTKIAEVAIVPAPARTPSVDRAAVAALARALAGAGKPIIFAGGGAVRSGAQRELEQLAERLACPVVTTVPGRGAIPDDNPHAIGPVWDRFGPRDDLARRSDLILCVGTRLTPLATRNGTLPIGGRIARIDLDPTTSAKLYPSLLAIHGDARAVLAALLEDPALPDRPRPGGLLAEASQAASAWRSAFADGAPDAHDLLRAIETVTPRNTIVASDMTVLGYWAQRFLPVRRPGGFMSPYYFGTLGYGLPAALGAKAADSSATVVAICGDAGFLLNGQEMATGTHLGLAVHVVLLNDGGYGAVHADERRTGVGALSVSRVTNPKFDLLAEAYGWRYQAVEQDGGQLAEALSKALAEGQPSITEVRLSRPLPMPYDVRW